MRWPVTAEFRGDKVLIADLDGDAATARARELGPTAEGHHVEVTDENSMRALFDTAIAVLRSPRLHRRIRRDSDRGTAGHRDLRCRYHSWLQRINS